MEREVIWGKKVNNNFTVTDQPENKIIETLDEVREALHYDAEFSKFDTELYPHTLPDNLPYAYEDGQKTSVWEDGFITTSCILADKSNPDSFTLPETIKVKAENDDIWIGFMYLIQESRLIGTAVKAVVQVGYEYYPYFCFQLWRLDTVVYGLHGEAPRRQK